MGTPHFTIVYGACLLVLTPACDGGEPADESSSTVVQPTASTSMSTTAGGTSSDTTDSTVTEEQQTTTSMTGTGSTIDPPGSSGSGEPTVSETEDTPDVGDMVSGGAPNDSSAGDGAGGSGGSAPDVMPDSSEGSTDDGGEGPDLGDPDDATGTGGAPQDMGEDDGQGGMSGTDEPSQPDSSGEMAQLSVSHDELLWTGVRYYAGGTGVSNRTSGPQSGPRQSVMIENLGSDAVEVNVALEGPDTDLYTIVAPELPAMVQGGGMLEVELEMETDDSALGPAPAQDDGATVLEADLQISAGATQVGVRMYGLVLTYVELEPTFGQLLDAFSGYDSEIPLSLRNDANPNPGTLPGVEGGSDEVAAPAFTRADAAQPVILEPLARFSPPGLVPFGWYPSGDPGQLQEVGAMAVESDQNTNDKSRMLLPPLARGGTSFEPDGAFGIWMEPDGVGVLYTHDGQNFDGQHRVKVWTMRDGSGDVIPNTYLIGGEEASNGDYQDYVFVLSNVSPM
jgi:hypothetical protein